MYSIPHICRLPGLNFITTIASDAVASPFFFRPQPHSQHIFQESHRGNAGREQLLDTFWFEMQKIWKGPLTFQFDRTKIINRFEGFITKENIKKGMIVYEVILQKETEMLMQLKLLWERVYLNKNARSTNFTSHWKLEIHLENSSNSRSGHAEWKCSKHKYYNKLHS